MVFTFIISFDFQENPVRSVLLSYFTDWKKSVCLSVCLWFLYFSIVNKPHEHIDCVVSVSIASSTLYPVPGTQHVLCAFEINKGKI